MRKPAGPRESRVPPSLASSIFIMLAAAGLLAGLAGCNTERLNPAGVGIGGDQPPDTRIVNITGGSPQGRDLYSYQVHLNWIGTDTDGRVTRFLYAWDDTLDAAGKPAWRATAANESTFVVTADSSAMSGTDPRTAWHFRTHTFWIKAVDDQGACDPTPAYRTFTATTVAPEARIVAGPGDLCSYISDYVYVAWRGDDPDGRVVGYWYKWNAPATDYPARLGPDPAAHGWHFVPAETTSVVSRQAQLSPGCSPLTNSFSVFAVDDAGAIQTVAQRGANWVCFCPDSTAGGSGLCVDAELLGIRSSQEMICDAGGGQIGWWELDHYPFWQLWLHRLFSFDRETGIFLGSPVKIRWTRSTPQDSKQTPLVGYRYSVDQSETWEGPFDPNATRYPPAGQDAWYPAAGYHTVEVEAADRAGAVDRGTVRFQVCPGPAQSSPRPASRILLVDDNGPADDSYTEWRDVAQDEPANWATLLSGFRYDTWETQLGRDAPGVPFVKGYTTVIWNVGIFRSAGGHQGNSLHDQLFLSHAEYLSSYVRAGGNLLILGMNPLYAMTLGGQSLPEVDLCGNAPGFGSGMNWDPSACGLDPQFAYPHLLFTRFGVTQMWVPVAGSIEYSEVTMDRTVRGCLPVDAGGLFDRRLEVDSLRAGGHSRHLHMLPAGNVTTAAHLESWVTPIYAMDSPDPSLANEYIGLLARGDANPRREARDTAWGNAAFLGLNPYFIKVDQAAWFMRTLLASVFGEQYSP